MGNKMTSTPYGLKVKEHTNHADYKDIFEDVVFKIYYNESTHVWTIKSNYDRLWSWSEGTQYFKGDTILEFTNTLTQEKTVLGKYDQEGTEVYRNIMYRIKCYQGEAGAGATKQLIQITGGYSPKTYDKETVCTDILHTHTSVYYNGKWHVGMYLLYDNPSIANCWMKKVGSLAITYAKPYWFLMTTQAGIEYGGQVYEARKLIRSWSPDEFVNMSLYYHKTRKRELPNPDTDKFDKLVYDVQCFAPNGQVTLTYEINAVPQDSVTFNPSDSPVRFHNIEFKASSDKWTIYSKCGYIKFDGKTYKTNKSIFSVGFDENLHVEIKDESNIYEIEETTTYTVKSVQVGSISYKLWTTTIDKAIKIEKTVDTVVEPWITVRYYEAMYEPITIDDLIIEFSNVDMKWYLKSNNDDLYCNGSNYKKGELIDYWDYEYIQNLKYITVLVTSVEDGIEIKKISSGDVPYLNNDIDEIYDEGLKICYSTSKGLWEIVSVDDETYYNGIQFLEGQTIVSFKDRTILDQFTILVKKIIPGEEEYDNVIYTCYTGVDLINGITTLTINGMSWANKTATDANKSTIVTKDMARSMYGYIWQKEETPPVPPFDVWDFIVPNESGSLYYWFCEVIGFNIVDNNWSNLYNLTTSRFCSVNYLGTFSGRAYYSFTPNRMVGSPGIYWVDNLGNSAFIQLPNNLIPIAMEDINVIYCTTYINGDSYVTGIYKYSIFNDVATLLDSYIININRNDLFPDLFGSYATVNEFIDYDRYFYKNDRLVIINPKAGWEFYNQFSGTFNISIDEDEPEYAIRNYNLFEQGTDIFDKYCELYDEYDNRNRLIKLWAADDGWDIYYTGSTDHLIRTAITFLHNRKLYMYMTVQIRTRYWYSSSSYRDTIDSVKCNLIILDPSYSNYENERYELYEEILDPLFFNENIACLYGGNGGRVPLFNSTIKFGDDYYIYVYEDQSAVVIGEVPILRIFKLEQNNSLTKVKEIEVPDQNEEYFLVKLYTNKYDYSTFEWLRIYYDNRNILYNGTTGQYEVGLLKISNSKRNFYTRNGDCLLVKIANGNNPLYVYFYDPLLVSHPNNFAYFGLWFT